MRIPERDVTYIVLPVYLLTLIHRQLINCKQDKYPIELKLDFAEKYTVHGCAACGSLICWPSMPSTG